MVTRLKTCNTAVIIQLDRIIIIIIIIILIIIIIIIIIKNF